MVAARADLTLNGTDPVITGNVGTLFDNAVFAAPAQQLVPRIDPEQDALAVSSTFSAIRRELAAKRPQPKPAALPSLADYVRAARRDETTPLPMALASIDPELLSAALTAIEKAIPIEPFPTEAPAQLAYARAVAPPSIFDTPVSMRVSEKEFRCLTDAVYFEARGEPYRGQAAVAQVVLNRVHSPIYPNSICAVVYQNQSKRNACQFSFACDGIPERVTEPEAWKTAKEVAEKVLRGEIYLTEVANATHYHASYVHPDWVRQMKKMTKIGLHIFYRFKNAPTG